MLFYLDNHGFIKGERQATREIKGQITHATKNLKVGEGV